MKNTQVGDWLERQFLKWQADEGERLAGGSLAIVKYNVAMFGNGRRAILIILILFYALYAAYLATMQYDSRLWIAAARDIVHGANPYHDSHLVNTLLTPLLFVPFASLDDNLISRALAFLSGLIAFAVVWREKRHMLIALLLLFAPLTLRSYNWINLDWLVVASLLAPPPVAFLLALAKPQIGAGVALLALLAMWQKNKALAVLLVLSEVVIYAASYAFGMRWSVVNDASLITNYAAWPYGLIVGLPLMYLSLRRRDAVMALAAMPFCAPYVGVQSWISVLPFCARFTIHYPIITQARVPPPEPPLPSIELN